MAALDEQMQFQYPFRKYQELMLAQVEANPASPFHLVAPPGSGKTIVGLELIRRFGQPAVVFAPTTTIQRQWHDRVDMFFSNGAVPSGFVTTDPTTVQTINSYTYQLISVPAEADERVAEMARARWHELLLKDQRLERPEEAEERLWMLERNNPEIYRKELRKHATAVKRLALAGSGEEDLSRFLHPNAVKLIDSLVSSGVKTVVLDECHHLLDYWAIVLRYLITRIDDPKVIGLTATLPSPEDAEEYVNYTSLLGEVDFRGADACRREERRPGAVQRSRVLRSADRARAGIPVDHRAPVRGCDGNRHC